MKDSTKVAVDKAVDSYREGMIDAAADNAIRAHISGDIAAHTAMHIPIGNIEVQREALIFGRKYKKLLKETGGTVIQGKRVDWLAEHTEETRKAVYETIRQGLVEGKPVASIGGKLSVPGTVAHDLEKLAIRDSKYKYVRIARTETSTIQNQGSLNRFKKNNITHVLVSDGHDFDEACADADGQTWTVEYASTHELEHPNCTRSFGPIIPDEWEPPEKIKSVKKSSKLSKTPSKPSKKPSVPTKKAPEVKTSKPVEKIPEIQKPKIIEDTPTPKPGISKPITPKAEISEISDTLTDRQIKTSNFGKLAPNVDLDDPAHWDELLKRGWSKDAKFFKKSQMRMGDVAHLDKNGDVFAISRYEIKGKTLRIKELELNPAVRGPEYQKAVLRDIADDGLANGAFEINVSAWDDVAKELYNSAGLKQGTLKSSFSADIEMMKELAGKTDLVVTSRAKETAKITRHLKKLEKSNPEDLARYKDAVGSYTTERYKLMNSSLREGIDSKAVKAQMTAKEHEVLKREVDTISEYLKGAPKFKGEVYRGVGFDDKVQFDDFIKTFKGNTQTTSPQFTSTSIIRTDAEYFKGVSDFSATIKIKSNGGSYIGGLSDFKGETEVLFNHNTKFNIKKIIKISDNHYDIELEDITDKLKAVKKSTVAKPKAAKKSPTTKPKTVKKKVDIISDESDTWGLPPDDVTKIKKVKKTTVVEETKIEGIPSVTKGTKPAGGNWHDLSAVEESKAVDAHVKKLYTKDPKAWAAQLDDIQDYTEGGYEGINAALRKNLKGLDKAAEVKLKKQISSISDFIENAPKSRGNVYRGLTFDNDKELQSFLKAFQNNDEVLFRGFVSTSADKEIATGFTYRTDYKVILNIKSSKGVFMDSLSMEREMEVLLNHHTNFKISSIVKKSDKFYEINLEELLS